MGGVKKAISLAGPLLEGTVTGEAVGGAGVGTTLNLRTSDGAVRRCW